MIALFRIIIRMPRGRLASSEALEWWWSQTFKVQLLGKQIEFHTPNWLTYYRAASISKKEPETLNWINSFEKNSVFWDVGANIGTFTIYAASRGSEVIAIEPSHMNLEILVRNVVTNGLTNKVTIIPCGVSTKTSQAFLFMSPNSLTWGGAHNSLGENMSNGGQPILNPIQIASISFSLDDLYKLMDLHPPTHLKIDVDGLELEILKGANQILEKVNSVLVESDKVFKKQSEGISKLLREKNFRLNFETSNTSGTTNQIWVKV